MPLAVAEINERSTLPLSPSLKINLPNFQSRPLIPMSSFAGCSQAFESGANESMVAPVASRVYPAITTNRPGPHRSLHAL